jgi:PAS domain S-box-containing protein
MPTTGGEAESLAQAVIQSSIDGLAVMDRETRYILWNRTMERFAGKTAAEVLGRKAFDLFPFLRDLGLDKVFARVLAGESVATEGAEYFGPDGVRRVFDRLYAPMRASDGTVTAVLAIVRDASARYVAEAELRKSEAMLRMSAEATGVGVWSWDPESDRVSWDDTMATLFGVTAETAPRNLATYLALVHPEDRNRVMDRVQRRLPDGGWTDEYRVLRKDGSARWILGKAKALRNEGHPLIVGTATDVTDRREKDELLRAAQRLEAIGELTAGIAHNFNNILMGLLPNLELAVDRASPELAPMLRDAKQAAERAADVVRQLMTYAGRNRPVDRTAQPIAPLLERTAAFCRTTFDRRIKLDVRCDPSALASVDATQLEQAILNLLINARDAFEHAQVASPTITVAAGGVMPGAAELDGRTGDWLCIRVSDNGVGMDPATVERVYEPFFTTKGVGRGTGLGLATTLGIVREHQGFIECRSEPGRGTTFTIYLRAATAAEAKRDSERMMVAAPVAAPSRETVLVVDDEPAVRRVLARVLEDGGFQVRAVASGDEALRLLADPKVSATIPVILLDVSMPGLSGPETRARLSTLVPDARVAYLTGYAYEATGGDEVIQKPVRAETLLSVVQRLLPAR